MLGSLALLGLRWVSCPLGRVRRWRAAIGVSPRWVHVTGKGSLAPCLQAQNILMVFCACRQSLWQENILCHPWRHGEPAEGPARPDYADRVRASED
jgi:hypothetical protein